MNPENNSTSSQNTTGQSPSGQTSGTNSAPNIPATTAQNNNTLMSVLAYLGPLVIVSYVISKDIPEVKFHIKQGFVLLSLEILSWLITTLMFLLFPVAIILNIATIVLSIVGIIRVLQHKQEPLPVVGQFSKHFTF